MKSTLNIAIFAPNENPYSETFIQAQKNLLPGNIFYYYGSDTNIQLENEQIKIRKKTLLKKGVDILFNFYLSNYKWKFLLKSLKKNKIDVMLIQYGTHAHNLLPFFKYANIPFVVHFHGYDATMKKVLEKTKNYGEVFREAKKVIAVSKDMYKRLLGMGCNKNKLHYNACGPNDSFLDIAAQFSKNQLLAIGRFVDKKAPYYTVMAFAKALNKIPNAKLIMMGNGNLLNTCKNIANTLKVSDAITFSGIVTPETFKGYLETSRGFVQHSITAESGDMEGTPLAVLEASAAGLPVISTYHAGIPDVVKHGDTGLLCDEGDVDTMAENMIKILKNKELAKEMGAKAKDRIEKYFAMDIHINNLYNILESASK